MEESTGMKNATEQLENRAPDCDESDSTEMAEEAWDVRFCPVLTTTFDREAMEGVARLVTHEGGEDTEAIDGLILTSQRAAEALLSLLPSSTSELEALLNSAAGSRLTTLQKLARGSFPIFVIGPATYRLLASHPLILQSSLLGRETGNGASLAAFVLKYYETLDSQSPDQGSRKSDLGVNCSQQNRRRTLLFPTGDPHRDIIPKSLSSPDLPTERRLNVIEETVYRTVEDSTFAGRFARLIDDVSRSDQRADVSAPCLDRYQPQPCLWVVVFSPQGCAAMIRHLRANALLPSASPTARRPDNETESEPLVRIRVATIGPTTAEYLRTECDFEPDVVADTPSPAGIRQGIEAWRANTARSKVGARSRHE